MRGIAGATRAAGVAVVLLLLLAAAVSAQQAPPAVDVGESNNPLSSLEGVNFNAYYAPSLYDADGVANLLNSQFVLIPRRRHLFLYHLIRATLPVLTVPADATSYASGLGDFTIQDAFKLTRAGAKTEVGIGPLLVAPTATSEALGAGKWQAGAALVAVHLLQGGSVMGAAVTWQTDFAGDSSRPGTNNATIQPTLALAIGTGGFYLSSSAIWTFDFKNDRCLVPFSLGVGKVFTVGKTIVNMAVEPQITIYHKGEQQPAMQLYLALQLQRRRLPKHVQSALAGSPTGRVPILQASAFSSRGR